MNGLPIKGRMLSAPRVIVTAEEDRVRVRVDCEVNDEYWTELELSAAALIDMLESVVVLRGGLRMNNLAALKALRESMTK